MRSDFRSHIRKGIFNRSSAYSLPQFELIALETRTPKGPDRPLTPDVSIYHVQERKSPRHVGAIFFSLGFGRLHRTYIPRFAGMGSKMIRAALFIDALSIHPSGHHLRFSKSNFIDLQQVAIHDREVCSLSGFDGAQVFLCE